MLVVDLKSALFLCSYFEKVIVIAKQVGLSEARNLLTAFKASAHF